MSISPTNLHFKPVRETQRQKLVTLLSAEITSGRYEKSPQLPSENQLCQQYGVSRVTVRLALSDLQARGLIFRQHGKGTFAHRLADRAQKGLAILMEGMLSMNCLDCLQIIRGIQSEVSQQKNTLSFLHQRPLDWNSHLLSLVGGVIASEDSLRQPDLDILRQHHIPILLIGAHYSDLPRLDLGFETCARIWIEAFKKHHCHEILILAESQDHFGADKLSALKQFISQEGHSIHSKEFVLDSCLHQALDSFPGCWNEEFWPEAILVLSPSLGPVIQQRVKERKRHTGESLLLGCFSSELNLVMVPSDQIALAEIPFYQAGQKAAQVLLHNTLHPEAMTHVCVEPTFYGWAAPETKEPNLLS